MTPPGPWNTSGGAGLLASVLLHAAVDQVAARVAVVVTLQDEVHTESRERRREVLTALLVVGVVRVVGRRVDRVVVDEHGVLGLAAVLRNDVGDEADVRLVGVDACAGGVSVAVEVDEQHALVDEPVVATGLGGETAGVERGASGRCSASRGAARTPGRRRRGCRSSRPTGRRVARRVRGRRSTAPRCRRSRPGHRRRPEARRPGSRRGRPSGCPPSPPGLWARCPTSRSAGRRRTGSRSCRRTCGS